MISARSILSAIGLLESARKVYYWNRKAERKVLGIKRRFWATSPSLYRRVKAAGGEQHQLERFISSIRPGDVVWDVGSFMGMYSMFASCAAGREGRVYPFEPVPEAFSLLGKNASLNGAANVFPMNMALGDRNGKCRIYSARTDDVAIHSLRREPRLSESGIDVEIAAGDSLIERGLVPAPDVVKVDVEGADFLALDGMRRALKRPECRFLLIEVHPGLLPGFGNSVEDVRRVITESGFKIGEELERGDEVHLVCSKDGSQC